MDQISWGTMLFLGLFPWGVIGLLAFFLVESGSFRMYVPGKEDPSHRKSLEYRFSFIPFYAVYFMTRYPEFYFGGNKYLVMAWSALNLVYTLWYLYLLILILDKIFG